MAIPPITADSLEKRLKDQIAFLDEAIRSVREGTLKDISVMDLQIESICRDLDSLDAEDSRRLETSLAEVIGKLEDLAKEIRIFQDTLESGENGGNA